MLDFFRMSGKEIILLAAEVAILLSNDLTADEQNTLGNFLQCVGQDIITSAGQKEIFEKCISTRGENLI